ncbi:MAG: hypothetical protein GPJ18_25675 [Microcystis aeruginosa F13-15]|jgi:hypothetical protein|nr:hypothetical protein [Microcystis aeruginosa F13-15]
MRKRWHRLLTIILLSLEYSLATLPLRAEDCGLVLDTTVTADNHYKLVVGPESPGPLQEIGRNEFGPFNVPDIIPPVPSVDCPEDEHPFNWSCPESFQSIVAPNILTYDTPSDLGVVSEFYLYSFVWGESAVERTFLGEFGLIGFDEDGNNIFSGNLVTDEQWDVTVVDNFNPGDFGDVTLGQIAYYVNNANNNNSWVSATSQGFNVDTTLPWQKIPGITEMAEFIADNSVGDDLDSLIYRRRITVDVEIPPCPPPPPTPEPPMLLSLVTFLSWTLLNRFAVFKNR